MRQLHDMSDREVLIHLVHKVYYIEKLLTNHLRHSWGLTLALVGITGTAIVSLLIVLLSR